MENDVINKKIVNLWEKYESKGFFKDKELKSPMIYIPFTKNAILFISMNPSLSERSFNSILKDRKSDFKKKDFDTLFNWNNFNVEKLLKWEKFAVTSGKLIFKKFEQISKKINLEWYSIDLFVYRSTNQSKFRELIYSHRTSKLLNDFAKDQLKIAKEIIEIIKPKIIIVANKEASDIVKEEFNVEARDYDENLGVHFLRLENNKVPIFFSGILSSQRALDNYNYERLKWHIKFVYDKIFSQ